MRNRRSHRLAASAVLAATVLLSGCLTTWNTAAGPQTASKIGVTADLPPGWARFNPDPGLVMTRDGLLLQSIRVSREKYGTKLLNTDNTITKDAEAHEAAQVVVDALSADQSRHHVTVLDNRPATVAGRPGFRLEVTFQTAEGLTLRETVYFVFTGESYVIVRYIAPNRHYHERDLNTFERVVASLKIDETVPPARKP
jgi:hypothetical protein